MQMKNATSDWLRIGQGYGPTIVETFTIQSTLQLIKGDQIRLFLKEGGIHDQNDAIVGQHTHFVGLLLEEDTVPTKLLGTPPFFQCILMALRVLEKMQ